MINGFGFGQEFQRAALRLMCDDDSFCALASTHFRPTYFENQAMAWTFATIQAYYQQYNRPPTTLVLYESLRDLDPMIASQHQPTVDAIAQNPAGEAEFIASRVIEFVKRNLFVEGFEHARRLYNEGQVDAAYDFHQRRMEEINSVVIGSIDRGWFFEELDENGKCPS